jgi:hypothetical protein
MRVHEAIQEPDLRTPNSRDDPMLPAGITQIEDLAQLRSTLEIWTERAAKAVWGFRRQDGAFWKDSKAANDPEQQKGATRHITTTARAYIALQYAHRVFGRDVKAPWGDWVTAFERFVGSAHMTLSYSNDVWTFKQKATRSGKLAGDVNTFDIAHLADFIQVADYISRFGLSETSGQLVIAEQDAASSEAVKSGEPVRVASENAVEEVAWAGEGPASGCRPEESSHLLRRAVVDSLNSSVRKASKAGANEAPNSGEVQFDDRPASAHYFATLHALRALHAIGEPVPNNINEIVEGAKAFAVEQCFYFQRGTRHRQDPVRLAFAGSIYAIYGEHVDKDLCLAIVEALHHAQQDNGNWPATHPIFREENRPWHIASHEVALCLTWLYFQPKMPDSARPTLMAMMRRYLLDAVAPTFFSAPKHDSERGDGKLLFDGWQDDHTVGTETTVGWATAIICHFLANFSSVLDDWINRRVIEELGLELSTDRYLIDDVVGKPAVRWQRGYTSPDEAEGCGPDEIPNRPHRGDSKRQLGEVWPDLPPHGWAREKPEVKSVASNIHCNWTDPSSGNAISENLAQKVILPILASADQRPERDRYAGLMPGQPGTRKTSLVERIAATVLWPKIAVPASLIFAQGFDRMEAQANYVFERLNHLRRCVIFFDEFEEFFVSRKPEHGIETADGSYKMRTIAAFTTSAMLPRLQELHDKRWCLIFLATNHLDKMDEAIKRRGRFDFQVVVNHPTADRLLNYLDSMSEDAIKRVGLKKDPVLRERVVASVKQAVSNIAKFKPDQEIRFAYIEQLLRERHETADAMLEKLKELIQAPDDPPGIEHL